MKLPLQLTLFAVLPPGHVCIYVCARECVCVCVFLLFYIFGELCNKNNFCRRLIRKRVIVKQTLPSYRDSSISLNVRVWL